MSLLSVDQVTHGYGDKTIFQEISFRLVRGEHAGLVGRNGAGKSTLLRILAGELLPDSGKVEWQPNLQVGYLEQHFDLQAGMTIIGYLRGAFARLYEIERTMQKTAEAMAAANNDSLLHSLLGQYGELQNQLELSGFYQIEQRIEEVASGLGILELGRNREVDKLSGGQRTKLLLAKLLLQQPQVLLLDEPTNFLDTAHIEWLTGYLNHYEHAFLVVSHDERFLNAITTIIYHLEHRQIRRYKGNYDNFLSSYELNKRQVQEAYERQQKEISRLETFIDKNRNRKAKQAKSREKTLERIDRIEKPGNAPRPRYRFDVQTNPVSKVLEAVAISCGYTEPLFGPIDLTIRRGDKIAIVGSNGTGKSTMLKTLLGYMKPLSGTVQLGERVKPAYYEQEQAASGQTPLERIGALHPDLKQKEVRQKLALSGLANNAIRQPLHSLSGGEQAKVRLCELMLTESNVLVLDEPTNHLDAAAKQAFKEALQTYKGTVLLVSHEPEFYEGWVTGVWRVEDWPRQ